MSEPFVQRIEDVLGQKVKSIISLTGGSVGEVYKVNLIDGDTIVAKVDNQSKPVLRLEGDMLRYLAEFSQLPVPEVLYRDDRLLLLEYLSGSSSFDNGSQQHAALLLAELHNITADQFGFQYDTLIGGLHQPNPWMSSWIPFFREQRLLYMAHEARRVGRLPDEMLKRLTAFSEQLENWLAEPARPSLIHGDAWGGNILSRDSRITGFLDPAIYFADAEIELAFTTLFNTFSDAFFEQYEQIRPLEPGFKETRRDIYNIYPLLVHVRLFGGSYVASVDRILRRFGY